MIRNATVECVKCHGALAVILEGRQSRGPLATTPRVVSQPPFCQCGHPMPVLDVKDRALRLAFRRAK